MVPAAILTERHPYDHSVSRTVTWQPSLQGSSGSSRVGATGQEIFTGAGRLMLSSRSREDRKHAV